MRGWVAIIPVWAAISLAAQGLPGANPAITAPAMGSPPAVGLPGQGNATVGQNSPALSSPAGATASSGPVSATAGQSPTPSSKPTQPRAGPSTGMPSAAGSLSSTAPLAYGSVFEGRASWYGAAFKGRKTASGEIYDPEGLTAAHRSLPFGSLLRVTDLDTGASVVVRVNDRGPFVADRVIDLSEAAARLIGLLPSGTTMVRCELLRPEDAAAFGQPPQGPPPPQPATVRICRVQVASYSQQSNAEATLERLKLSGIDAVIEEAGPYKRVVIPSVPEAQVDALSVRLGSLGYRKILVSYSP